MTEVLAKRTITKALTYTRPYKYSSVVTLSIRSDAIDGMPSTDTSRLTAAHLHDEASLSSEQLYVTESTGVKLEHQPSQNTGPNKHHPPLRTLVLRRHNP